ncbi:hypothetical protein [Xanthomonas sp. WHRI 7945]|nr:hypothetical protein [Xanthomonas campestris pv. campestris]
MNIETVAGLTDLQIRFFTALGQTLVALAVGTIAALIAWRQWKTAEQQAKTARNKLRLDLYERRLAVFKELNQAAIEALGHNGANKELNLLGPMAEARYLFGAEVHDFVSEKLYVELVDLSEARETRRMLNNARPFEGAESAEYQEAVATSNRIRKSIYKNLHDFRSMMDSFLVLEH